MLRVSVQLSVCCYKKLQANPPEPWFMATTAHQKQPNKVRLKLVFVIDVKIFTQLLGAISY